MARLGWVICLGTLLSLFGLSGCATPASNPYARPQTLAPAFAPTVPSAQAWAQATLAAVAAGQAELANTATALANAQMALELLNAQAQMTDVHAAQATATEQAYANARATENAQATLAQRAALTAEAQVQASATQAAQQTQEAQHHRQATATVSAQQTATAWPLLATAQMATTSAIVRQTELAEDTARWQRFTLGFWNLLPIGLLLLVMGASAYAYVRLLPVLNLRLRTRTGAHGETLVMLDEADKVHLLIPGRSVGPLLSSSAPLADPEHQLRVTTQDNAVRLMHATPPQGPVLTARPMTTPLFHDTPSARAYHIVPAAQTPPPLLADPDVLPILEARWKELDDA